MDLESLRLVSFHFFSFFLRIRRSLQYISKTYGYSLQAELWQFYT